MRMLDVNVLIYAHREDAEDHDRYAEYLQGLVMGSEPFALPELVLSAFLRLVTNQKLFKPPTPMPVAIDFCQQLLQQPRTVPLRPTARHWETFLDILRQTGMKGRHTTDAYLAALAMEHGCEVITADSDFARFPGLRWRHPLAPG